MIHERIGHRCEIGIVPVGAGGEGKEEISGALPGHFILARRGLHRPDEFRARDRLAGQRLLQPGDQLHRRRERVPQAHADAQVVRHAPAQDHPVRLVDLERQWLARITPTEPDAVRDVERRIQKAEEQSARELPTVLGPAGIPGTFEEHAKLMFDLQALAYQADQDALPVPSRFTEISRAALAVMTMRPFHWMPFIRSATDTLPPGPSMRRSMPIASL